MKDQHVLAIHLQLQIIEHQSSIMNFKLGVLGVLRHFAQLHSRILLVWVDRPQLEFLHWYRCLVVVFFVVLARIVVVFFCCGFCWLTTAFVTCDNIADGEIYDIFATISFNPKTNMLFDLRSLSFLWNALFFNYWTKFVFSDSASLQLAHKLLLQSGTNHHLNSKVPLASIVD